MTDDRTSTPPVSRLPPYAFEVGVVGQFEAAHHLEGDFGPAQRRHGHTYRVEVAVRGATLRDDSTLCDIGLLQASLRQATAALHYRDLDELEAFQRRNSTAEAVAQFIWEQIAPHLTGLNLELLSVRLWESPQAYASCEGSLEGGER